MRGRRKGEWRSGAELRNGSVDQNRCGHSWTPAPHSSVYTPWASLHFDSCPAPPCSGSAPSLHAPGPAPHLSERLSLRTVPLSLFSLISFDLILILASVDHIFNPPIDPIPTTTAVITYEDTCFRISLPRPRSFTSHPIPAQGSCTLHFAIHALLARITSTSFLSRTAILALYSDFFSPVLS